MFTIYKQENKWNLKNLFIWIICVGGMGFGCILLYESMQADMADMAKNFASMGAFSDAFGMSQLSIATLIGFYAAEVGTIHALGGAMFAALISISMLSKEEDGHTGEFLFSLPVRREKIILAKWLAIVTQIVLFNLFCVGIYCCGFIALGEEIPVKEYLSYHLMQTLMQIEIAAVCYAISAFFKKNKVGIGLGIVLIFYAYDMMARIIPALADYKIWSPFSYANASDILSGKDVLTTAVVLGMALMLCSLLTACFVYRKKDLAA